MREALNTFLHNAEGLGSSSFFLFLLLLLIAMGLWSTLTKQRFSYVITGPAASKLFLGVRMRAPTTASAFNSEDFIGHIVNLDLNRASFISPVFIPKGEKVTMSFASIPDFPSTVEPYTVSVTGSRVFRGQPSTYLIHVSFATLAPALRSPLVSYVQRLARQRRPTPAL